VKTVETETPCKPGDSISIAPNEQHCVIADADNAMRMICCIPS
jgi:quercetin dioxygenase-like cupin family protein